MPRVAIAPDWPEARLTLGYALQAQGKSGRAVAAYVTALELKEPVDLRMWFEAACSTVHAGNAKGYRDFVKRWCGDSARAGTPMRLRF